jgi:dienelactone hydrolase
MAGTVYRRAMRAIRVILATVLLAGCAPPAVHAVAADPPPVTTRVLQLARGRARPLPVTLWYRRSIAGRHPIILFSHGLGGLPRQFAPIAATWVGAGYVVAAPTYPHTNARVRVDASDVRHQPADAAYVLDRLRALDRTAGDPLAGHLATDRVAAIGFSAGATTTLGMLTARHDPALRAAVSIAGRRPPSEFGGPAVPVLFLHGDRDRTVPIAAGRAAYRALPWPKRFVPLAGEGHGQYLNPGDSGYPRASALILEFLRANLG